MPPGQTTALLRAGFRQVERMRPSAWRDKCYINGRCGDVSTKAPLHEFHQETPPNLGISWRAETDLLQKVSYQSAEGPVQEHVRPGYLDCILLNDGMRDLHSNAERIDKQPKEQMGLIEVET